MLEILLKNLRLNELDLVSLNIILFRIKAYMDAMFRTSNKYYRAYVNELEYVRNNIILKLFLPVLFKFLVNGNNI